MEVEELRSMSPHGGVQGAEFWLLGQNSEIFADFQPTSSEEVLAGTRLTGTNQD